MPDTRDQPGILIGLHQQHTALAQGGHRLGAVEAEAAEIAESAHMLPMDAGIQRLGAVLHDLDAVRLCQLDDGFHIAGHAQQVHSHDHLGLVGDLSGDVLRVDGPGVRMDVAPNQLGAGLAEGDGGGAERIGRHDDLVAGLYAAKRRGQTQGIGGVVHGESVLRAGEHSEVCLELCQHRALRLAVHIPHHMDDRLDLFLRIGMLPRGDRDTIAFYCAASGRVTLHNS